MAAVIELSPVLDPRDRGGPLQPMLIARDFQYGAPAYDLVNIGNQNYALRYAA